MRVKEATAVLSRLLLAFTIWSGATATFAQSTAPPAQIGYLSTSGCPYGLTVCFVQYGAAVPVTVSAVPLPAGAATSALQTSVGATAHTDAAAILAAQGAAPAQQTGSTTQTIAGSVTSTTPASRTLVTLDVKTVTTGGTAVTAIAAGHRTAGGFLQNPVGASVALCIAEIGTASGTTSSGDTTCIQPGQSYTVAPAAGGVSVITSDSSHPFSGYGLQ